MLQKIWYGSNIYLVEQIYFLIYLGDVIMVAILDRQYGYGQWGNPAEVVEMLELSHEEKKAYAKKLWQEDPVKYKEWKEEYCIKNDMLPDFFGTRDNPIPIDESKL